jgi:hypothetical protein
VEGRFIKHLFYTNDDDLIRHFYFRVEESDLHKVTQVVSGGVS